jgi:predicted glycogen debranching enzyme
METLERIGWRRGDPGGVDALLAREWLATNGLGGYAAGTLLGVATRRYHGLLVAALPNPLGRTMMLNHLSEQFRLPDGSDHLLSALEIDRRLEVSGLELLESFRLEWGLPVWTYRFDGHLVEKRLRLVQMQNTVHLVYRLLEGEGPIRVSLRPAVHFRGHDEPVSRALSREYEIKLSGERFEIAGEPRFPPLRLRIEGEHAAFVFEPRVLRQVTYRVEEARGYEALGELSSHGRFRAMLTRGSPVALIASTEPWQTVEALSHHDAERFELARRKRLVRIAGAERDPVLAELALAADAFPISPAGRIADATLARAQGEDLRSVIAGYHWFTDWGRDTMISLEGLTLETGREVEARWILRGFAQHVRDGLIPNLFPEGAREGLYHTADATLWFFHALDRYVERTGDRPTLEHLYPVLEGIVEAHLRGTRFGIRVDPEDGLLAQGEEGYALTWMDAKCDGWVVTPRRGKAVELQALWYNALRVFERWTRELRGEAAAHEVGALAARVAASFQARFWREEGWLADVVDGDPKDARSFRPNQILAIALPNPVLARERWAPVLDAVRERLWTPCGLRSLSPDDPDYKPSYHGDLRTRDAAYHQGTVWSWLVGPFVDAWLAVRPGARAEAREMLAGLVAQLGGFCLGSIPEVFDAEPPFRPRGCVAQAWGVAELLRAWRKTAPRADDAGAPRRARA